MSWTALLWSMLVVPSVAVRDSGDVVGPIEVMEPDGGPGVIFRRLDGPPLVAIRLSVPVEEAPGLEGAARLLQELTRERLEAEAEGGGARLELERTPGHAVYAVVGPRETFDSMVALLRRAVGWPTFDRTSVGPARLRVEREALAALELPGSRVRIALEDALYGSFTQSARGRLPAQLGPDALEWFWRRFYAPTRMTVTVVGAVPAEVVASAFRGWPAPHEPAGPPPAGPRGQEPDAPEAIAPWAGIGWSAAGGDPAALAVAASLVSRRIAAAGRLRQATVELLWEAGRVALIAIGSVMPLAAAAAPEPAQALRLAVVETARSLTPAEVASCVRDLRRRLLFDARTPQGLAALLGRFHDRTGDPGAAPAFLAALARVDAALVRAQLGPLIEQSPVTVEVVP